jgi:hypothetical protein
MNCTELCDRGKAAALHIGEDTPFQDHYTFISRLERHTGGGT